MSNVVSMEEYISRYTPIVKKVVGVFKRTLPVSVEYDDIFQEGMIALYLAYDKCDFNKPKTLTSYLYKRIHFAIVDNLRITDQLSRVSRQEVIKVNKAKNTLLVELGRQPTRLEIASKLKISTSKLNSVLFLANASTFYSIYDPVSNDEDGTLLIDTIVSDEKTPDQILQQKQEEELFNKLMQKLTHTDRYIISLYQECGYSHDKIGQHFGFSASRSCQLTKAILKKLLKQYKREVDYAS